MKQKKINLDNEFKACWYLRKNILQGITDINILLNEIKKLQLYKEKNKDVHNLFFFIEGLALKTHGEQQNNHNYMHTFLKEKVQTHHRIKYDFLEESLAKGKLSYANDLSPKLIMSNYFISNENENILEVTKLETAFRNFTRSARVHLAQPDRFTYLGDLKVIDEFNRPRILKHARSKINQDQDYEGEIEDIKKYFALQFTRREFYLYNIIKTYIGNIVHTDFSSLDILDYLCCKYIYNKSLKENFNNWLDYIGYTNNVYQVKYMKVNFKITHKQSLKIKTIPKKAVDHDMAITEMHTFSIDELLNSISPKDLNKILKENEVEVFSEEEIQKTTKLFVTLGSKNKLCYLMTEDISIELLDKINFVIQNFWDEIMVHKVLINLLLKKSSPLNSVHYFKNANISKSLLERAKFMKAAFDFSEKYEDLIKKA